MIFPKVTIIIINWNNWKDSIECLESVYKIKYPNYDIILLDNGSKNDSLKKIEEYCEKSRMTLINYFKFENKNIKVYNHTKKDSFNKNQRDYLSDNINKKLILIKSDINYGFTEGNNIAVRFTLKCIDSEYLMLLNNDTVVDSEILSNLVQMGEHDRNMALIQPKLLYYYESNKINTTGNQMDMLGSLQCRGVGEIDKNQYDTFITEFFSASGACVLIRKSFISEFNENELFDPLLFAYHEDVDLSFSARVLGHKIAYSPDAICYHKEGSSFKNNYKKYYWAQRNNLRVLIKNYSFKYLIFIIPSTLFIDIIFVLSSIIFKRKLIYLKIFINSLYWNLKHLSSTLEKRRNIQNKRKVPDKDITRFMEHKSLKLSPNNYVLKRD